MGKAQGYNQQPLTTAKMFTASWTERDEAILVELLNRKIKEMRFEIKKVETPYAKNKLRKTRTEYRELLEKIERGDYDPDILAAELKTHHDYNQQDRDKRNKKLGKYVDAYADVDFDFQTYFSKSRYFGAGLPIIMMILLIVFVAVILSSVYLSTEQITLIESQISLSSRLSLTSINYMKVQAGPNDFYVVNDGKWPKGSFTYPEQALEYGEVYEDEDAFAPTKVYLNGDLGMNAIDITVFDIIKALFRTELFSQNRVDFIENLDAMQGYSWYYIRYIRDRADDIEIVKGEDGNYNNVAIVKRIATFGTIYSLVLMILAAVVELFINIGRLFSYTSRKVHFFPILIVLCGIATLIFPAFLEIASLSSADISLALNNYFTVLWQDFANGQSMLSFNMLFAILLAVPMLMSFLPLFFKNRPAKTVAYVPKGNKPHTYAGDRVPTRPGQPGASKLPKRGPVAVAGTKSGYSARYPGR